MQNTVEWFQFPLFYKLQSDRKFWFPRRYLFFVPYTHISGKLVAYKSTQVHKYTGVHKYTPLSGKQVDYKSTQVHKYKGTQVQMCISTQVHKNTPMSGKQVAYKSTQVHK